VRDLLTDQPQRPGSHLEQWDGLGAAGKRLPAGVSLFKGTFVPAGDERGSSADGKPAPNEETPSPHPPGGPIQFEGRVVLQ
jgi:hypothetical protein